MLKPLFRTAWDMRWRTEDYSNGRHPYLSADAAAFLAKAGAALVGIDSYNIDDTVDGRRPAHSILLAAGIPIVEHLCGLREYRFSILCGTREGERTWHLPRPGIRGCARTTDIP